MGNQDKCHIDLETLNDALNDGISDLNNAAKRYALTVILKESKSNIGSSQYEARWGKLRPDRFEERDAEMVAGIVLALKLTQNTVDDKKQAIYDGIVDKLFAQKREHAHYSDMDSAMRYKFPNHVARKLRFLAGKADEALGIRKIGYCNY